MRSFLQIDPGLVRRFRRTIRLPDYTTEQLVQIVRSEAIKRQVTIEEGADAIISNKMEQHRQACAAAKLDFGNAGDAVGLLEQALIQASYRRSESGTACRRDILLAEDFERATLGIMSPAQ